MSFPCICLQHKLLDQLLLLIRIQGVRKVGLEAKDTYDKGKNTAFFSDVYIHLQRNIIPS